MKIPFRQGIISAYMAGASSQFLQQSTTANYVSFAVGPTPTLLAFAHGSSDYLQVLDKDVDLAWGPLPLGPTSYLYWELVSHVTTRHPEIYTRFTFLQPLFGDSTPVSPGVDQHWFDTTSNTMKVWSGHAWITKVALFAGSVPGGMIAMRTHMPVGVSHVGINTSSDPGFIMLDAQLRPVHANRNLEFLTTTSPVRIQTTANTSGVLAIPPNAFIPVKATENIPQFSLVCFVGEDSIGLASSNPGLPVPKIPIGVVQEDLNAGELGVVTQSGEIQWDQWDWSASLGQPLYCGDTGEITTVRPNGLVVFRVGFVKNRNTILFGIDSETLPQIYQTDTTTVVINGVSPINTSFVTNGIGERVWTIEMGAATQSTNGFMTSGHVSALSSLSSRVTETELALPGKASLVHTHIANDVTDLPILLAGKSNVGHNHDLLYSYLGHNHDLLYSSINHQHNISGVTGLQDALNLLQIAVDGKALLVHTHSIANVTGLQAILDAKSPLTHIHAMSDVTGLVTAIANKSDTGHIHAMSDVTGLTAAISLKSDVGHLHAMSDVTGLVASLTGKADTIHTHAMSSVTGLTAALTGKADVGHEHALDALSDVSAATPEVGQALAWSGIAWAPATITATAPGVNNNLMVSLGTGSMAALPNGTTSQILTSVAGAPTWVNAIIKPAPLNTVITDAASIDFGSAEDHNRHYRFTSAVSVMITVQPDSFFPDTIPYWQAGANTSPMPIGGTVVFGKHGSGDVAIVAGAGVTINSPDLSMITKFNGKATLIKVGVNEYDLEGNLATV